MPDDQNIPPPSRLRGLVSAVWPVLRDMGDRFMRQRVLGLAAEVAFFAILSLPPLIFGLAGAVGFVAERIDPSVVGTFRDGILGTLAQFLSPNVIADVVAPTLDSVLSEGRADVVSIGFLIALWSGSRTLVVLMDTIAIMYGQAGHRSILRSWAMSFGVYLALIIIGAIVLPTVVVGPTLLRIPGATGDALSFGSYLAVWTGGVAMLAAIYHVCLPARRSLLLDAPGALLTLLIWLVGSDVLKFLLSVMFNSSTLYGPLAAPIAVLMWLYLMALAVLVGAAFNAALEAARRRGVTAPVEPTES